jgi:hypothetical protein
MLNVKMLNSVATFDFDGHKFVGPKLPVEVAGIYYLARRAREGDSNATDTLIACQVTLKTADGRDYFNYRTAFRPNWGAALAHLGDKVEALGTSEELAFYTDLALRYSDGERSVELYNAIMEFCK